jgi:hypothetical protein
MIESGKLVDDEAYASERSSFEVSPNDVSKIPNARITPRRNLNTARVPEHHAK